MKKTFICFTLLSVGVYFNSAAQIAPSATPAQSNQTGSEASFQSGSLIVSMCFGIDVYSLKQNEQNTYLGQTKDTTTGAASRNFNIAGEYAVTKWLGLGLQLKFDNYFHDNNLQSAFGFEGGLLINGHIIRHKHFDLFGGLNLGRSSLTLTGLYNNNQIYGSGSWFDVHFTAREYIGRFGFSETLYIPSIDYNNLTSNVGIFNEYIIESWKASGVGFNWGIQYHFLK